ncbi:hypothetical protein V6R21_11450 [Limibacter armeniacum]|uniref:hypothetical protein n=1 Tax=Limibacter armeniacum TaxID=466084 RepID=UPI002FE54E56
MRTLLTIFFVSLIAVSCKTVEKNQPNIESAFITDGNNYSLMDAQQSKTIVEAYYSNQKMNETARVLYKGAIYPIASLDSLISLQKTPSFDIIKVKSLIHYQKK